VLETGVTYTLTAINNATNGNNGLPSIGDNVTVTGNGSTIRRDPSLFSNDPTDPCSGPGTEFRIFHISVSGNLTINDLTVSNGCSSDGGGIFNVAGTLEINNSSISGNSAGGFGGGIDNRGTLEINNSAISGNSASEAGGIFNLGILEINNTTISGNSANVFGGGIENSSTAEINSSTISGNSARGGGIFADSETVVITNTIVANQVSGGDCLNFAVITSLGYNIESGTSCGFTNTGDKQNTDPMLGPLQNNGGPTDTHALLDGSMAIDMGDHPAGCFDTDGVLLTTDQRGPGFPRTIDGDAVPGAICDIGAYEFGITSVLQHFKCYDLAKKKKKTIFETNPIVTLQDQFDAEPIATEVKNPVRFCNPVEKTGAQEPGEIIDETAHLTCYSIDAVDQEPAFEKMSIFVDNQIVQSQQLDLLEPSELCVPSLKNFDGTQSETDEELENLNLDHFKCYKLERKKGKNAFLPLPITVALEDQFDSSGPENYIIEKPFRFCNPVDKNGEDILDMEGHLTCYKIKKEEKERFQSITVESDNQFKDDQMLTLSQSNTLCIPSEKRLTLTPTPPP